MKHRSNSGHLPPEFYYDQEQIKEQRRRDQIISNDSSNRIVVGKYVVPIKDKEDFRRRINLRSKSYTRKTIHCELCNQDCLGGWQYADREGWIYYLCKSCASQVGGPTGRKLIISTPMGGQNKRY